ncbi:hypothetical protein C437_00880 [Haloarcula vallismortis ATCC 29715]|uniref:Uncharacterized protein n=1 Tax=Haloarcula vallismortis ATCC 29715 TaxID=662477 RepID=M0JQL3_HALVA|nr:hypothetical protein C437_00880 [Haloarcula vallismortis ATCC 29715]
MSRVNIQAIVLGAHGLVAVVLVGFGVLAAASGDLIQFALLTAIGVMVGLLGRSVSRLANQL